MTPVGMKIHVFGPIEGRRHDWTSYVHLSLEEELEMCLNVNGAQYCIYGDIAYSLRVFLIILFQGGNLTSPFFSASPQIFPYPASNAPY